MDNTALFTAAAALDPSAPEVLRIAGDQESARDLGKIASEIKGSKFELVKRGSLKELESLIQKEKQNLLKVKKRFSPSGKWIRMSTACAAALVNLNPLKRIVIRSFSSKSPGHKGA